MVPLPMSVRLFLLSLRYHQRLLTFSLESLHNNGQNAIWNEMSLLVASTARFLGFPTRPGTRCKNLRRGAFSSFHLTWEDTTTVGDLLESKLIKVVVCFCTYSTGGRAMGNRCWGSRCPTLQQYGSEAGTQSPLDVGSNVHCGASDYRTREGAALTRAPREMVLLA
jgi:hypothetical protein